MNYERIIYEDLRDARLEELAQKAHALTIQRFGKTIELYAPIYLSNYCVNSCRYCGYNASNQIKRIFLTPQEVLTEAEFLLSQGHRNILLVAGEDTSKISLPYLEEIARKIRGRVARLSIETGPFDEASYRRLLNAGAEGVTLYQETYHRKTYEEMHPAGPKADYESRLEAIEAAGGAGMRFLGIGALLGLYDWRYEAISLVRHARELKKKFWEAHISISFPRIRDSASNFKMPYPVTDRELAQMIITIRLALPDANLILSTREPADLRDRLLPLGITQMSAGSVTTPGGYTKLKEAKGRSGGEQFHIEDTRPSSEVAEVIKKTGYQPIWKNWEKI